MNMLLWTEPKRIFLQYSSEALKGKEFARLYTNVQIADLNPRMWTHLSRADLLRLSHSVTKLCNCASCIVRCGANPH